MCVFWADVGPQFRHKNTSTSESASSGVCYRVGHYCTVNVALLVVILPMVLLTATAKRALLSAKVVAGVVYVALVAPATLAPFFVHW